MLVQIEPGEEPELGLQDLAGALRIVRVRHPLPACHRMRVLRPAVVFIGASVREWSLPALEQAAGEIGAAMLQLGPLVIRPAVRDWLRRALEATLARRARREKSA